MVGMTKTTSLPHVTNSEKLLLNNLARNLYTQANGGYPMDENDASGPVWTWSIGDGENCPHKLKSRSIPGIVASLSKKGLVSVLEDGKNSTVGLTSLGYQVWKEHHPQEKTEGTCTQCGMPFRMCDGPTTCKANQERRDGLRKAGEQAAAMEPTTDEEKILHVLRIPNAGYVRKVIRDRSGVGEEATYRILRKLVAEGRIHVNMKKGIQNGRPFRFAVYFTETK